MRCFFTSILLPIATCVNFFLLSSQLVVAVVIFPLFLFVVIDRKFEYVLIIIFFLVQSVGSSTRFDRDCKSNTFT